MFLQILDTLQCMMRRRWWWSKSRTRHQQPSEHCSRQCFNICKGENTGHFKYVGTFSSFVNKTGISSQDMMFHNPNQVVKWIEN